MPSEVLEPSADGLTAFVDALPKAELHVHLEGSIAPSTLLALARSQPDSTLPRSEEGLRELYRFRDFAHFLEVYLLICRHLRSAEDFALITRELGASLAAQNVRYAEVTVTPMGHVLRGVAPEALFEGIEQGRAEAETEHGVRLRWCTDIDGRGGPDLAVETVELVLRHRPAGLVSLGLGGDEVPRAQFGRAFEIAHHAGLHSVPHAGEAAGPQSVWDAIDRLGAERVGHGVRCLEDPELVAELRRRHIPLEVCPTSNVCTGIVADLAAHPLPRLIEEGLLVTLNSDDPPMFGTSLRDEYITAARVLGIGPAGLRDLARNAARTAFLPQAGAQALLAEIDNVPLPPAGP
ncbi:MAG TPA: adenosine deaminase [Actinomycetes bacterium]|jgi:aminodeoxyfutalosine deaminase|nr:adenosine deaminase [Actinomycetes bacterium]